MYSSRAESVQHWFDMHADADLRDGTAVWWCMHCYAYAACVECLRLNVDFKGKQYMKM